MKTCKQIQVIETSLERRGAGTIEDPVRIITQYWSLDGKLLAEVDPLKTGELSEICEEGNLEQRNLSHLRDINLRKSVHRSMAKTTKCDPPVYSHPSDFFVGAFVKNVCKDNPCRPFTGVVICVDELSESGIVRVSLNNNGGNIDCHYSELKVLTPEPANDHPDSK